MMKYVAKVPLISSIPTSVLKLELIPNHTKPNITELNTWPIPHTKTIIIVFLIDHLFDLDKTTNGK